MPAAPLELNLRHLHALATAIELGSISLAADAEGLSQPALTQGIAKIERQLGVALLERRTGGVAATEAGQALALRVRAAFARLAEASRRSGRGGTRGFARPERLVTATQLRAFINLADRGSFAAAAEQGQSQPAVHRAVRDLESLYGVPLAERRGRGVVLTTAGRRLARGGRLAVLEIAAGLAEALPERGADRIAVGAMPLCRALVLPHAIADYGRAGGRATIDVREGSWRELVEPLQDGQIDLMIGALRPAAPAGLVQQALFEDRLIVVGRADHPLAAVARPSRENLLRYPWIVAPSGAPLRALWQGMFGEAGAPAAPIECGSVMVIRGVLARSDCLTLLSRDQVALEVTTGMLRQIGAPVADAVRTIGITYRETWRSTPAQESFVRLLRVAVEATRLHESR